MESNNSCVKLEEWWGRIGADYTGNLKSSGECYPEYRSGLDQQLRGGDRGGGGGLLLSPGESCKVHIYS